MYILFVYIFKGSTLLYMQNLTEKCIFFWAKKLESRYIYAYVPFSISNFSSSSNVFSVGINQPKRKTEKK